MSQISLNNHWDLDKKNSTEDNLESISDEVQIRTEEYLSPVPVL